MALTSTSSDCNVQGGRFKGQICSWIQYFLSWWKTYGHVWTQVLIGDTWICGDTTDLANKFGSISSWNVNKYTLLNKYLELPF